MNLLSNRIICLIILAVLFSTGSLAQLIENQGFRSEYPAGERKTSSAFPSNATIEKLNHKQGIRSNFDIKRPFDTSLIVEKSNYPFYHLKDLNTLINLKNSTYDNSGKKNSAQKTRSEINIVSQSDFGQLL